MARTTATNKYSGVYGLFCESGKVYIGSSIDLYLRLEDHRKCLEKNDHYNIYLQRAWNKYGELSFDFTPLLYCSQDDLLFYEQLFMDYFFDQSFNICKIAGSPLGIKHTKKVRKKMSDSKKGILLTEEHKEKIGKSVAKNLPNSAFKKGMTPWNKDTVGDMIAWNKGLTGIYSDEIRIKMGIKNKGRTAWNKGISPSKETRVKIGKASKGRIVSEETRNKLRIAAKKQWHKFKEKKEGALL